MSETERPEWRRTSPLAAVFYLGKIYQALARNALQSLAPLAAFLLAFQGDTLIKLMIAVVLFVLATIVHAFLRYWFFRYRIADDSILMRDGVFKKRQLDIKFARVQGINTTRNVIDRFFGLVTVNFDTAGSAQQEASLPAIERDLADSLKDRIRRAPARRDDLSETGAPAPASNARTLMRLSSGDIVRTGLSSGRVFLVLVLIGPLSEYIGDQSERWVEESALLQALGAAQISVSAGIAFALLVLLGILLILLAASIAGALLRYHGYELVADEDVLRSGGGLLTRHEHSVNRSKVQSLHIAQNVMLRLFRRYRLRARQATSGRSALTSRFDIPICNERELFEIGSEIFQEELTGLALEPRAGNFEPISAFYLRSRILLFGILPSLLGILVLWPAEGAGALLALLWIPLASFVFWRKYRCYGVALAKNGLALRRGFVGYRVVVWLHRKVQRVSVTQSPFQRRRNLATIRFYLAAGSVTVPFVDYAAARTLRDYVLYSVESSQLAWH